jgi:hypothetical protein
MSIPRSTIVRGLAVIVLGGLMTTPVGALDTNAVSHPGGTLPTQITDTIECRTINICIPYPTGGVICIPTLVCSRHW